MDVKRTTLLIDTDTRKKLKILSIFEGISINQYLKNIVSERYDKKFNTFMEQFSQAPYDDEPLSEEDLKDMEETDREIKEGMCKSLEQVIRESG